MKHIPAALLVAEAIYLAFVPVTVAHSIILFSLAALFAFQSFLTHCQVNNTSKKELAELKEKFESEWKQYKEAHAAELSRIEGELVKIAVSGLKSSPSSSPATPIKKTYTF